MALYVIYKGPEGYAKARPIEDGENFDGVAKLATSKGFEVLRPHAISASSASDAVDRFSKAAKLRDEASVLAAKVPTAAEDYQKREEDVKSAKKRDAAMQTAQRVASGEGSVSDWASTLLTAPQKLPRTIQGLFSGEDRGQTAAANLIMPFEGELAQDVLGDPTMVPSMLVPGVGEARAASILGKVGMGAVKAKREAPIFARAADALVQGASSTVPGIVTGDKNSDDLAVATSVAAGAPLILKGMADVAKAGGRKIIESSIKAKSRYKAGDGNKFDVDALMGVEAPKESKVDPSRYRTVVNSLYGTRPEKIIKGGAGIDEMGQQTENAIQQFGNLETAGIKPAETPFEMAINEANIRERLGKLREAIAEKVRTRVYNKTQAENATRILDEEEARLLGGNGVESPTLMDLHRAKQEYGKLGRFDLSDASTTDPTARGLYRDLGGLTRSAIIETEGARTAGGIKALESAGMSDEKFTMMLNARQRLQDELKLALSTKDVVVAAQARDLLGKIESALAGDAAEKARAVAPFSDYGRYARQMAPLMAARQPLEDAAGRTGNSYPVSLQALMGAAVGGGASQSVMGALAGAAVPMALQGARTGTGLYRLGERIPDASRYAIPLVTRASGDN